MSCRFYVGGSGWRWTFRQDVMAYKQMSPFNCCELDFTFYRFPKTKEIEEIVRYASDLRWSVRVHRSVTHSLEHCLDERAIKQFRQFVRLFTDLESEEILDFYVFLVPPRIRPSEEMIKRIRKFERAFGLGERMAIEFRNDDWYKSPWLESLEDIGVTVVSIDAPGMLHYVKTSRHIYVRCHGRKQWYMYVYSDSELEEIVEYVSRLLPADTCWIVFDNDPGILRNGERIMAMLKRKFGESSVPPRGHAKS